jgi:hypothetical protein
MASLLIDAKELSEGDVLLLAMGKTATVKRPPKVGRQFVTFYTEYGKSRVEVYDQVLVQARVL